MTTSTSDTNKWNLSMISVDLKTLNIALKSLCRFSDWSPFCPNSSNTFSPSFPLLCCGIIWAKLPCVCVCGFFFLWFKWVCNCLYYFHYSIYLANNIFLMKVTNWWGTPRTSQAHNIGWVVNSVCVIRWSVLYSAYTLGVFSSRFFFFLLRAWPEFMSAVKAPGLFFFSKSEKRKNSAKEDSGAWNLLDV